MLLALGAQWFVGGNQCALGAQVRQKQGRETQPSAAMLDSQEDSITNTYLASGWKEWRLEFRKSGMIYLHLRGLLQCDLDCRAPVSNKSTFLGMDPCENRTVETMDDYSILFVLGVPARFKQPPRGIELVQPVADLDSGTPVYVWTE